MTLLPANPTHSSYQSIAGELSQFFKNIRAWDYPKNENRAFQRSAGTPCFFGVGTHRICLLLCKEIPVNPRRFSQV